MKACSICGEGVEEECGKLSGTMLKVREENRNVLIYVCSGCQKKENWIELAKIKAA